MNSIDRIEIPGKVAVGPGWEKVKLAGASRAPCAAVFKRKLYNYNI